MTSSGVKTKKGLLEKKCKVNVDYGRTKYSGIDMAFIYIRGKRMLTISEVSRKLYPQWPRTTLSDRMKQLKIQRHACTPREIEKVYSVNGVVKKGIHCMLISKEDLDVFCNVYKSNALAPRISKTIKGRNSATRTLPSINLDLGGELIDVGTGTKQAWRPKQNKNRNLKTNVSSLAKRKKNALASNKQSQIKDKSGTRVVVKGLKTGEALGHKRHVALKINKAIGKQQQHVVQTSRSHDITAGQLSNSRLNNIRKRKHLAATGKETENATAKYCRQSAATKRKRRDTNSPASDCTSFDSGISSLSLVLDPALGSRSKMTVTKYNKKGAGKTKTNNKNGLITKNVNCKVKCNGMKIKNGTKFKNTTSGLKRKGEKMSNKTKSEKETGHKKPKMKPKINKTVSNKITKEFIMKMDLKHMNDNDLIKSISPLSTSLSSSENTPHSEDTSYLVRLMPVKPVWKVNSNFRFISNFVLPPSLVVQDGELRPACSMVCNQGLRPPSAHPVWKWKVGEPVIGNKTEISYCVKKVKCI